VNPLREKIEQEIRARGPIPFSRYMELCLYDEEFGYYSRHPALFGKAGDFYTSSDVHAVFGRLLARQFEEMWRVLGRPEPIVLQELGPGRGLFARDVLDWSEKKFPDFFRALHYVLSERSPALRSTIEENLSRHFESGKAAFAGEVLAEDTHTGPGLAKHARPEAPQALRSRYPALVFANEFFDALPVEIVGQGSLCIDCRGGRFVETWAPSSPEELEFLDRYSVHPAAGERIEVPLQSQAHMGVASGLERGFLVIIDYGYTREDQLAGRHRGTLKAIRRHSVSANPYQAPGGQDITARVNFTGLASVAQKRGLCLQKLRTQSQFLMGIGEASQFADAFEECRLPQERAKVALQLKHLVTPAGLGENFHVLVASQGIEAERAAALTGFSFGRRI